MILWIGERIGLSLVTTVEGLDFPNASKMNLDVSSLFVCV